MRQIHKETSAKAYMSDSGHEIHLSLDNCTPSPLILGGVTLATERNDLYGDW